MLVPWKKSHDKPRQHIKKHRFRFVNKGPHSQSYDFFPVIVHRCESWTIRKPECCRMDAFQLWCWRRLLRVPLRPRKSNKWILQEVNPEYSQSNWYCSWSSNTLEIWWEEPTHWKRLMSEKIESRRRRGDRGWDGWMASWTQWAWVWANSRRQQRTGKPGVLQSLGLQSWTWFSN